MVSDENYRHGCDDGPDGWYPLVPPFNADDQSEQGDQHKRERYRHREHGWSDHQAWVCGFIGDADYAFLLASTYVTCFNDNGRPKVELSWNSQSMTLSTYDRRLSAIVDELFFGNTQKQLTSAARHGALRLLTNQAVLASPRVMALRTAMSTNGRVGIDIGHGRVVTFAAGGFTIGHDFPVAFRAARPLPTPAGIPDLMRLRAYINADDAGFQLIVAWLTFALLQFGPYPVLHLVGEHGSAKSTASRVLRYLLDGKFTPGGGLPDSARDFDVLARKRHGLFFDNLSSLPRAISDKLCRLATGSDDERRANYTDDDLVTFEARRPILITGIANVIAQSDLADRALVVEMKPIQGGYRSEDELHAAFMNDAPRIMAGVLQLIADGLVNRSRIPSTKLPRMADFCRWALAIESCFWTPGSFMAAFDRNHEASANDILDDDVVAQAIFALLERDGGRWQGTASDLLVEVGRYRQQSGHSRHAGVRQPRSLSEHVTRLTPDLRKRGIAVWRMRVGCASAKLIVFERLQDLCC